MNKKKKVTINEIIAGKNFHIQSCFEENKKFIINVVPNRKFSICPLCGRKSHTIVASYKRTIQDTPLKMPTYQVVLIHKYRCLNPSCPKKIFSERLSIAGPRQVRTHALNLMILNDSILSSDSLSSRRLSNVGIDVSRYTIQRMYDDIEYRDDPNVTAIGIDDVSVKRGERYATVIYDLDNHHILALLNGRDGELLKPWLENHKKITVVARDRDSSLAEVIKEVLPNCEQVSDRFHLIQSLIRYLNRNIKEKLPNKFFIKNSELLDSPPHMIKKEYDWGLNISEIKVLDNIFYDNTAPLDDNGKPIIIKICWRRVNSQREKARAARRMANKKRIEEIRARCNSKELSVKKASEIYGSSIRTIRKYLNKTPEEVKTLEQNMYFTNKKACMSDYVNIIYKMMDDNFDDRMIFSYISSKGYKNSSGTLWTYINNISKKYFPDRATSSTKYRIGKRVYPTDVTVITRAELLRNIFENKSDDITDLIRSEYPLIDQMSQIYQDYYNAIMGSDVNSIDKFIDKYADSIISGFCNRLKKDIAATHRAISSPISSGFVEGNNTKLKLLEQILFHKGSLVNLFQKAYLAFMETDPKFDLKTIYHG